LSTRPDKILIDEVAAGWAVRRLSGDHVDDPEAFERWLAQSPSHVEAYGQAEAAWRLIGDSAATAELAALRRAALERFRDRRGRGVDRPRFDRRAVAAAVVGLTAAPLAAIWWLRSRAPHEEILQTSLGEQRTVVLSDGTRLLLDAMTLARVNYTPAFRTIDLVSGRAYLEVAKDAERPLRVRAGPRTVTAIGTAFSVERDAATTSVLLAEGRVSISNHESRTAIAYLEPRQELALVDGGAVTRRDGVDVERALAWRAGKLVFDNVYLQDAAARMNRYSTVQIVCVDSRTQRLRISGIFRAGESSAFVEAVQSYFPVEARTSSTTIELRSAR
jgi:transmembrane sensor